MKLAGTIIVTSLLALAGCARAGAHDVITATQPDDEPHKVFVCKYVGKPGVDERLQTGDNPISVDISSLEGPPVIGQFFEDAQGRSVVIAFDTGQPEPPVTDCPQPPPPPPPPTTTTTTEAPTTTTTECPPGLAPANVPSTTSPCPTTTTAATTTTSSSTTTSTSSTTSTTTTIPSTTTSTTAPPSSTTAPEGLNINALTTVCIQDAPFVEIRTGNQPQFNGHTATITFRLLDGGFVETHTLTYQANSTFRIVYPGAEVDPVTGEALDWPGWVQTPDGSWVTDPTDAAFRDGLVVTVEVNPTATSTITYPPATSACANPEQPVTPPDTPTPDTPTSPPTTTGLPEARWRR